MESDSYSPAAKRLKTHKASVKSSSATWRKGDDETLNPDDADKILEELLEVQNNSYVFGLRLHLPQYVLDDIHKTYLEPRDRLLQVLKTFLKRVKPRPTWPIIIKALNDPAVNLPRLARIGEAAHLPCSTTTCESVFPDPVANLETSTSPTPSSATTLVESRPTLPQLHSFNSSSGTTIRIIRKIGLRYNQLGLHLLNDVDGSITSAIVVQYQSNAEAIIQEILARWLQGQGLQPVTWSTLICVLKKVDLWELARMIQKCLIEAQIQENTESQLQLEQQLHAKEENIRKLQQAIRQKETEKDENKDKELKQAQVQLRQLRQQELSSRREIDDLQERLQSNEDLMAEFQMALDHRDFELEILRPKLLMQAKDRELAKVQQQLKQLREQVNMLEHSKMEMCGMLESIETQIAGFWERGTRLKTEVSGPGLRTGTANVTTHIIVKVTDSSNRPCSFQQNVTAELVLIFKETPSSPPHTYPAVPIEVVTTSPSHYKVPFTPANRGQHKLYVRLNDAEIDGSPFIIIVYPDPTKLAQPVNILYGLNLPYGIAFDSHKKMVVTERMHEQNLKTLVGNEFQEYDVFKEVMTFPKGIAFDNMDNMYVTSQNKLHKFNSSGKMIDWIGPGSNKKGEFNDPRGVAVYDNKVYVCDTNYNRIQVFDLDLNFIQYINSHDGESVFNMPKDIKFDSHGFMYVVEWDKGRVQVLDRSGHFKREFGDDSDRKLQSPTALHIVDKYLYVSQLKDNCIFVYETSGQFITSFGHKKGEFVQPRCITSCADGFIYICDSGNHRVQVF